MHVHQLHWYTHDAAGNVLSLYDKRLADLQMHGLYAIYTTGGGIASLLLAPTIIRVGQGDIQKRLAAHRIDIEIILAGGGSPLSVAFAQAPQLIMDGAERFLANVYRPLVGDAFPHVAPIPVNLPLAA